MQKRDSPTLKEKRSRALVWLSSGQRAYLDPYKKPIEQRIDQLQAEKFSERLWRKEPDLWKSDLATPRDHRQCPGLAARCREDGR